MSSEGEQPAGDAGGGAEPELTSEEVLEAFKQLKTSDLVVSTMYTLSQLAYGKLDPGSGDLPQARLAIESLRALIPVVRDEVGSELVRDFEQVLANLQLAYASAAGGASGEPPAPESSNEATEAAPPSEEGPPARG